MDKYERALKHLDEKYISQFEAGDFKNPSPEKEMYMTIYKSVAKAKNDYDELQKGLILEEDKSSRNTIFYLIQFFIWIYMFFSNNKTLMDIAILIAGGFIAVTIIKVFNKQIPLYPQMGNKGYAICPTCEEMLIKDKTCQKCTQSINWKSMKKKGD